MRRVVPPLPQPLHSGQPPEQTVWANDVDLGGKTAHPQATQLKRRALHRLALALSIRATRLRPTHRQDESATRMQP